MPPVAWELELYRALTGSQGRPAAAYRARCAGPQALAACDVCAFFSGGTTARAPVMS
jgi:hypothetical protein